MKTFEQIFMEECDKAKKRIKIIEPEHLIAAELYASEVSREKESEWKWKMEKAQEEINNLNSLLSFFEEGTEKVKLREAYDEIRSAKITIREKVTEAISLAKNGSYEGVSTYSKWVFDYSSKEILKQLGLGY